MKLARTIVSPIASAAEAVLAALPHPIIVIAPDGRIADANAAAEGFFESPEAAAQAAGETAPDEGES